VLVDGGSSPHAANESSAIAATESTAARGPRCRFIFASYRMVKPWDLGRESTRGLACLAR
jgi:hypothetical protein